MNETAFWSLIEGAWEAAAPSYKSHRLEIIQRTGKGYKEPSKLALLLKKIVEKLVTPKLTSFFELLPEHYLIGFDKILHEKLDALNTNELYQYTDGGDDSFQDQRNLIVAMGREYYELILREPERTLYEFGDGACGIGFDGIIHKILYKNDDSIERFLNY